MKIAVVGGGSTYTPELVSGLAGERERLDVTELALQDIDPERLEVVGGLAGRMLERDGRDRRLREPQEDRDEDPQLAAAVDPCRVRVLLGDRQEELAQEEDRKSVV